MSILSIRPNLYIYLSIIICAICFFSGPLHATELTIGLIPEQNVFEQAKRYKPLGDYIQHETGITFNFTIYPHYVDVLEALQKKRIDGAFMGSFISALAISKFGVEPIARRVNEDGVSTYMGYILVHKHSSINSVARMKHSVAVFVDKATTAGYVFPMSYLRAKGVKNLKVFFNEYYFAGSHDAAIYSVLNKEAEVGFAKSTVFDMLALKDPRIKEQLVILAKSPQVPSITLGINKDIPIEVREQIKKVLINMGSDPEGKKVLSAFHLREFMKAAVTDYNPVFKMAAKAGIDMKNYKYQGR